MSERVKVNFQRTLQVVRFEPCSFGVEYETEVRPEETPAQAHARAHEVLSGMFNQVQAEVIDKFGLNRQVTLGAVPPPPVKKK